MPLLRAAQPSGPAVFDPRRWGAAVCASVLLLLVGCTTQRLTPPAPVEDRTAVGQAPRPGSVSALPSAVASTTEEAEKPLPPGTENAGKPGYFTVRPGDNLIRIGLETGQNWRDLVRWNNLENPNRIEVGQVLRIVPPVAGTTTPVAPNLPAATAGAAAGGVVGAGAKPATAPAGAGVTTAAVNESTVVSKPLPAPASPARATDDGVNFIWPASGAVVASFDDQKNKGLGIAGKAGDPVLAAADGRVAYVGSAVRGYGNLIVIKHNNTYLTAYGHNQAILVREDQDVKQGQKIADMGSSDADRVKLHFEVRRQGKPVDPAKYLPAR